jgi:hypothetical protein
MSKHKLDRLFNHIEDLTSQQTQFEQDSVEWLSLEGQIVFTECMIFNKLLKAENIDINEYSAVLSLISLHLITYIEEDKFKDEINTLTMDAKVMMYLVLEHIEDHLGDIENGHTENN